MIGLMINHQSNCIKGCDHERHQPYHSFSKEGILEREYLWKIAKYITDRNISPTDPDDLELFQDAVFDSPFGRIHIFFYEEMFRGYYKFNPDWFVMTFSQYLSFLDEISTLFTNDAFEFVFRQKDIQMIDKLLKAMSLETKMRFIQASNKHPDIIQSVPKLKLYNLFS